MVVPRTGSSLAQGYSRLIINYCSTNAAVATATAQTSSVAQAQFALNAGPGQSFRGPTVVAQISERRSDHSARKFGQKTRYDQSGNMFPLVHFLPARLPW
jgi:hypothetical protein